jgi:HK97 gp10 family phage protein
MKVSVKIAGAKELAANLAEMERAMQRKIARGAVAAMGNEIKNAAKRNASAQGLDKVGEGTLPSGKPYKFKGSIPRALRARVLRKEGSKHKGVVYVMTKGDKGSGRAAPHWHWLEFGSINNAPKPFLRPAITAHGRTAINAAISVLQRAVARFNRGGK